MYDILYFNKVKWTRKMQEFYLDLKKGKMNVIRFGNGKKHLIIIPGITLSGLSNRGKEIATLYKIFSEKYDVCLIEQMRILPENYSVADMADDLFEAMNALEINSADMIGMSLGGMIGQYMAINHPEKVEKLVICSSASRINKPYNEVFEEWISLAKKEDVRMINHKMFEKVYSPGYYEKYKDVFESMENIGEKKDCRRFEILSKAVLNMSSYGELEMIKCPVFVIGAEKDEALGIEASKEIAQKLNCKFFEYKNYGHAVYDEAEDYKKRILDFLEETADEK